MARIFISYANNDRTRAQLLAAVLERNGWSVWWDRQIPIGRTFDEVIEEALDQAECVIVLWSKESVTSHWVKTEASEGKERNILIPVLLDDVRVPLEFRRIQTARLIDWHGESSAEFDHLLQSIKARIGPAEGLNAVSAAIEAGKRAYQEEKRKTEESERLTSGGKQGFIESARRAYEEEKRKTERKK